MSNKMFPFKTEPKKSVKVVIGNEEIGEIEISKLGGLTPNEKKFIKEQTKDYPDIQFEVAKLARKISKDSPDINIEKAYEYIMGGNTAILSEYLVEVLNIKALIDEQNEVRPLVYITAVMRYRVDPDIDLETVGNCSPELLNLLYEFVLSEQRAELGDVEPKGITEEDIKKS